MTSFTASSAGAPYSLRDIRSLYPRVTENHLRYLEQWRLLPQSPVPRDQREYSFADLQTIKHVAAEIDRDTPVRGILRTLLAGPRHGYAIARHLHISVPTARAWRRRFAQTRISGLVDLPRPGRPRSFPPSGAA